MLITDGRSITLPDTYKEKLLVKVPDDRPLTADCLSEILPGSEVRRNAVISAMRGVDPDARDALYLAVYHRWADDPLEVVVANVMAIRLAWTHLKTLGQFELAALERGIGAQIVTGDRTLHRLWPVSYTHLDVYKRQAQVGLDRARPFSAEQRLDQLDVELDSVAKLGQAFSYVALIFGEQLLGEVAKLDRGIAEGLGVVSGFSS